MYFFWEGIKVGLVLCFLLGPIFVALIQTGVEQGFRAGFMVGLGIWFSDLLFILGVYWGLSYVSDLISDDSFSFYLGTAGGLLLVLFGIGTLLGKPPKLSFENKAVRHSSWISLWTKGFVINTFNPFTMFFWAGLMGTILVKDTPDTMEASWFFIGIMGTVILTDSAKVYLAKWIRRWMKPIHLLWLRRISGAVLVIFGIVLAYRVL